MATQPDIEFTTIDELQGRTVLRATLEASDAGERLVLALDDGTELTISAHLTEGRIFLEFEGSSAD